MNKDAATPLPAYTACFVCGKENAGGLKIEFRASGEGVEADFRPKPFMAGYKQLVHGGITCAVLDDALVWAVFRKAGQFGVTAELSVRFLKPLFIGSDYRVRGVAGDVKRRIMTAEAELYDKRNTLMARASGKVMLFSDEQMKKIHQSEG